MRNPVRHRGAALACCLSVALSSPLQAELVEVIVHTGEALSVECTSNLSFGTVVLPRDYAEGTVELDPHAGATAEASAGAGFSLTGDSYPASCVVTATEGDQVVFSLSGGGAGASFSETTGALTGARLLGPNSAELYVNLQLNAVEGEVGETGESVYVGGTLEIPQGVTAFGVYQSEFEFTVIVAE